MRKVEKKINDSFNLSKNIRFSIISFAINVVLIFISYRLVIIYDNIESIGLWSLLMAWAALTRIGDIGMGGAIVRFISTKNIETQANEIRLYADTGLVMNFIAFFLLTLVGYYTLNLNLHSVVSGDAYGQAKLILPIMFAGIFFSSLTSIMISSMQALHYGYVGSYLTVVGNIIQIVCVLILVPQIGLLGLAWAQLIQYMILALVGRFIVSRKIGNYGMLTLSFSKSVFYEMFGFSLKAQVANISNGFFEPLSKILISQFGGLQAQGFYELAFKTVSLSRNIVISGLFASLPTLTNLINESPEKAVDFYKKSQKNIIKAITFVMGSVILFSPLVSIIWTGQFDMTYWFFVVCIALGFWVNSIGATAYNLGSATGKMKYNIISSLSTLFVLITVGYLMGNLYGERGIGIATALSLSFFGILIKQLNEKLIFHFDKGN